MSYFILIFSKGWLEMFNFRLLCWITSFAPHQTSGEYAIQVKEGSGLLIVWGFVRSKISLTTMFFHDSQINKD